MRKSSHDDRRKMMMHRTRAQRVVMLVAVLLGVLLLLPACRGALAPQSEQEQAQEMKIGFVPKALNQEFWITSKAGAEDVLTKQVDALAVAPTAPDQLQPVLERASKQVPVIIIDSDIPGWNGKVSYIGTDNVKGGEVAGEYIVDQLK